MMSKSSEEERQLIGLAKNGNQNAFSQLIQKYRSRIHQVLKRYRHLDGVDPEDLLQEVFFKAYRSIHDFKQASQFYTWLYRIAVNTAKNHIKNADQKMDWDGLKSEHLNEWLASEKTSPDHFLMRDEMEKMLFKTLSHMPDELKQALILREFEGLSYQEISELLECPIGTVRSRIFRARSLIDEKIKPLLEDPD